MYEAILDKIKEVLPKTRRYLHTNEGGEPLAYSFTLDGSGLFLVLNFEHFGDDIYHTFICLTRDYGQYYSHELVAFVDEEWSLEEIEAYLEMSLMDEYKQYTKIIITLDKRVESSNQLLSGQELEIDYDGSFQ